MPGLALHTVVDGDIVTDADGKSFIVREITRNSAGQISRIAGAPLAELAEIDLIGLVRESQSVSGKIVTSVNETLGANSEYVRRLWTSNVTQEQLRTLYYALNRIGVLLVVCGHAQFEPYPTQPPHDSERCTRCGLSAEDIKTIAEAMPPAVADDDRENDISF
jgi:hypothetical protein